MQFLGNEQIKVSAMQFLRMDLIQFYILCVDMMTSKQKLKRQLVLTSDKTDNNLEKYDSKSSVNYYYE